MFGDLNKNWRMRIKRELMQLSGYLHILTFFGISRLNWTDMVIEWRAREKSSI